MKTTIVAEIGSNWEGKLSIAKKIISECKSAGADAVKFQMWRATDLYSENHPEWSTIKKSELTFAKAIKIKQICDDLKIEFMCSVFYPEAVTFLESLGVNRYKIASRTCLLKDPFAIETLQKKASTKKPVIISMGMGGSKKKLENILLKNNITFCYCISDYPLNFNKINWKKAVNFDGFSDHTIGFDIPIAAIAIGARVIEKHFTLDKNMEGWDHKMSATPEELSVICAANKRINSAMGTFRITANESSEQRSEFRRSITTSKKLKKDHIIVESDLSYKRPGTGISPEYRDVLIGRKLKNDLDDDVLIKYDDLV